MGVGVLCVCCVGDVGVGVGTCVCMYASVIGVYVYPCICPCVRGMVCVHVQEMQVPNDRPINDSNAGMNFTLTIR